MAAGPAIAVTGDPRCFDFDGFRWIDAHEPLKNPVRGIRRAEYRERPAIDRAARRMIPKEAKQSMRFRV